MWCDRVLKSIAQKLPSLFIEIEAVASKSRGQAYFEFLKFSTQVLLIAQAKQACAFYPRGHGPK